MPKYFFLSKYKRINRGCQIEVRNRLEDMAKGIKNKRRVIFKFTRRLIINGCLWARYNMNSKYLFNILVGFINNRGVIKSAARFSICSNPRQHNKCHQHSGYNYIYLNVCFYSLLSCSRTLMVREHDHRDSKKWLLFGVAASDNQITFGFSNISMFLLLFPNIVNP